VGERGGKKKGASRTDERDIPRFGKTTSFEVSQKRITSLKKKRANGKKGRKRSRGPRRGGESFGVPS